MQGTDSRKSMGHFELLKRAVTWLPDRSQTGGEAEGSDPGLRDTTDTQREECAQNNTNEERAILARGTMQKKKKELF